MLSVCVVPSVGQGPELNEKDTVNWNQHYLFCASWLQMQSGYLPQAPVTMTDYTLRLWAKVNVSFLNLPLFKTIIYLLWCVWWGIERNCKSVLSYHVGLKNQTQVAVLGSAKSSYTTGPSCWCFIFISMRKVMNLGLFCGIVGMFVVPYPYPVCCSTLLQIPWSVSVVARELPNCPFWHGCCSSPSITNAILNTWDFSVFTKSSFVTCEPPQPSSHINHHACFHAQNTPAYIATLPLPLFTHLTQWPSFTTYY